MDEYATDCHRESWKGRIPDPFEYAVALRLLSRDVQIIGAWINGFEASKIK